MVLEEMLGWDLDGGARQDVDHQPADTTSGVSRLPASSFELTCQLGPRVQRLPRTSRTSQLSSGSNHEARQSDGGYGHGVGTAQVSEDFAQQQGGHHNAIRTDPSLAPQMPCPSLPLRPRFAIPYSLLILPVVAWQSRFLSLSVTTTNTTMLELD